MTDSLDTAIDTTADRKLHDIISSMGRVAMAFSGGVDSTYLLAVCADLLGPENVVALTADSPLFPGDEMERARQLAAALGVEHRVQAFDELNLPGVAANSPQRCYYCKRARFELLAPIARESSGAVLLHGENADDRLDYRPGARAAHELGVRAPLAEAGLGKRQIRELSKARGLATWDLPAASCLATRFPYDTPLTPEGLQRVRRAEEALRDVLGARQFRVRDHFPVARIEVVPGDIERAGAAGTRSRLVEGLKALGYLYVALDLEGYRMGSMNAGIETD